MTLGEILEIADVASEAREAQQRRLVRASGIVAIVEPEPVRNGEIAVEEALNWVRRRRVAHFARP